MATEQNNAEERALALRTAEHVFSLHRDVLRKITPDLEQFDPERFNVRRWLDARAVQRMEMRKLLDELRSIYEAKQVDIIASGDWWSFPIWWLRWEQARLRAILVTIPPFGVEWFRRWQERNAQTIIR